MRFPIRFRARGGRAYDAGIPPLFEVFRSDLRCLTAPCKDLDRETREEFNRFQEGCVEENTNTAALVRRLLSDDYADKVIVTTIQKLGLALDEQSKRNKQRSRQGRQTYSDLLAPLNLGWRERTERELALMADLVPLLKKRAAGRGISGLKAYEEQMKAAANESGRAQALRYYPLRRTATMGGPWSGK